MTLQKGASSSNLVGRRHYFYEEPFNLEIVTSDEK